jgi:RNA polymerase sigma-70 factor (ECF subfamily)
MESRAGRRVDARGGVAAEQLSARLALATGPALAEDEERALAARIRAGDDDAFRIVFHAYYGALHAFVLAFVHNPDVADECVQDVLHRVWELGAKWNVRGSVRTYLYTAARNRALNYLKHQRVTDRWAAVAAATGQPSGMGQRAEATDAACRRNELAVALAAAMARLPERRRMVLILRTQHAMKNHEIAEVVGISVKNVERHLMLALKTLRAELDAFF